jgi:hypothetical protein
MHRTDAWSCIKRWNFRGYLFLIATPVVPIMLACSWFIITRERPPRLLAGFLEVTPTPFFLLSGYYFLKYRNAICPYCKSPALKVVNVLLPIDPHCKSCGRRLDGEDEEQAPKNQSGGPFLKP